MAAKKTATNPFTAKPASATASKNPVIESKCASDIDEFVRIKGEIKALEGALVAHQTPVLEEAKKLFASRAFIGKFENIRLQGNESNVLFIVQDKSSGFSQSDRDTFEEKWGSKVAELLALDYSSFRVNPEALKDPAKAAKIQKALAKLQEEIGEPILLPGTYKTVENVIEKAKAVVKNEEKLEELINDLKITKFVRV